MPITVGIPFYNAEKYLADAIRSVFAQTYEDWELILIDDGSTDDSLEIAKAINDPRVSVYSDGENKKLAARLNEIVSLAKYELIARMDADDLMSPTRLEKQLKVLNQNSNLDLVTAGVYSMTNTLEIVGMRWHYTNNISFNELLQKRGCGVVHAAILGRKSWFKRNPYNTFLSIAQDYDLWLKASKKNDFKIYLMQEPLYYYREEDNVTIKKLLSAYKNERQMYKRYANENKFKLIIKSYAKSFIVRILNWLNLTEILFKRRSKEIVSEDYQKKIITEIQQIKKVILK